MLKNIESDTECERQDIELPKRLLLSLIELVVVFASLVLGLDVVLLAGSVGVAENESFTLLLLRYRHSKAMDHSERKMVLVPYPKKRLFFWKNKLFSYISM